MEPKIFNANHFPIGGTPLTNTTLWYLSISNHIPTYSPAKIEKSQYKQGNRFGGLTAALNNISEYEDPYLPLYKLVDCPGFTGLLLYIGGYTNSVTIQGVNNTGDGVSVFFYDINQKLMRTDSLSLDTDNSTDALYVFKKSFPLQNSQFILFGGRDAGFDVTEITLK